jgi:hypothetical protein
MPSLGNLFFTLGMKSKDLEDGAKKAEGTLGSLKSTMQKVIGTAAILSGIEFSRRFIASSLDAVDAQAKLAQSMDATIGGLRAVEMAAGDAGVATEDLYSEAAKLNGRLGDATRLTGAAHDALKQLGLNAQTLLAMDIDQRFAAIADAMRGMNLAGGQAQDIMRDLGVRNENLANLMRQGGDAFREQADEVRRLGLNLSMVDAAQVEAANRAIDDMGDTITVIQDRLAVAAAPYLEVLATKFKELTAGSNGFKDIISDTIKNIIAGFGKAADFINGLKIVFKVVEIAGRGFWASMISSIELFQTGVTNVGDTIATLANTFMTAASKVTGVKADLLEMPSESNFMVWLHDSANSARNALAEANSELGKMIDAPPPSGAFNQYLDDVANHAKATATEVVKARQSMLGGGGVSNMEDTSDADQKTQDQYKKDMEAWNAKNASELEAVKNRYMTEEQLIANHHEEMQVIGDTYDATKFETEEQWRKVHEQAEADHLERMAQMNKSAYQGIAGIIEKHWGEGAAKTANAFKSILGTMATGSRKAFEISKAWAMTDALISTYQGIAKGVAAGFPAAIPLVAAAAATGFAQVSAIRNQSFGGGGGAAASGNGAAGTAPNPVGVGGSTGNGEAQSTYRFEGLTPGSLVSSDAVVAALKQAQKDGAIRGNAVFTA